MRFKTIIRNSLEKTDNNICLWNRQDLSWSVSQLAKARADHSATQWNKGPVRFISPRFLINDADEAESKQQRISNCTQSQHQVEAAGPGWIPAGRGSKQYPGGLGEVKRLIHSITFPAEMCLSTESSASTQLVSKELGTRAWAWQWNCKIQHTKTHRTRLDENKIWARLWGGKLRIRLFSCK